MAWFKGTATDYKDLMDQLAALCEDEHVAIATIYDGGSGYAIDDTISITGGSVTDAPELEVTSIETGDTVATVASIVAGGTGYAVGDTLYIDDGTYTHQCILEVTSDTGGTGVVDGLQINDPGVYSVQPTGTLTTTKITGSGNDDLTVTVTWNSSVTGIATGVHISNAGAYTSTPSSPVATGTSGSGTGLILVTTYAETAWETLDLFDLKVATSATIAAGGSGHSVGDKLTVSGGIVTNNPTVFEVDSESGGAVTAVSVYSVGNYNTVPGNPVSTVSNEAGTGCTLTVTWNDTLSRRLYLHNTNTDVYIGIRTLFNSTYTAYTWNMAGYTGYTSSSTWYKEQPGFSGDDETYVLLANTSINYWFAISDNRMIGIFEIGSSFTNMYMGLLEPFLTASEYPYPLAACGSSTIPRPASEALQGGFPNPGMNSNNPSTYEGPCRIRKPDGSWENIYNWYGSTQTDPTTTNYPGVQPGFLQKESPFINHAEMGWYLYTKSFSNWSLFLRQNSFSDSIDGKLMGINGKHVLIPLSVADYPSRTSYGKFEGAFFFDNYDYSVAAKDRIYVGGLPYMVFHNCTHATRNHYFCLREA